MSTKNVRILLKKSSIGNQAPIADETKSNGLQHGELAVNYNADNPTLYLKDSKNAIRGINFKNIEEAIKTIEVGTVTTGTPGSNAVITATNDNVNHKTTLNFTIPKGVVGDQGAKGSQGDKGVQGDKGNKGDQGAKGSQGDKGVTGDPGGSNWNVKCIVDPSEGVKLTDMDGFDECTWIGTSMNLTVPSSITSMDGKSGQLTKPCESNIIKIGTTYYCRTASN